MCFSKLLNICIQLVLRFLQDECAFNNWAPQHWPAWDLHVIKTTNQNNRYVMVKQKSSTI